MNSKEGRVLSSLAGLPSLPVKTKLKLVLEMRSEYQAIGLMVAKIDYKFVREHSPKEFLTAVQNVELWAASNTKNRKSKI